MTADPTIAALIEADKKRRMDVPNETENLTYALEFIAAAANAMPAIVELVERSKDLDAKGWCPCCLGNPISGKPCVCAGTNSAQVAYSNVLLEHEMLRQENERLRDELAGLKEELSTQEQNLIGYQNAANYWKGNYDKSQAELGECRKVVDRLVHCYTSRPVDVAEACDEVIDRSGNLLGWIRSAALDRLGVKIGE